MKSSIFTEEWKDIEGYEGLYQVSNLGRVKSLARYVKHYKGGLLLLRERILTTIAVRDYLNVNLYKEGKIKMFKVHRLVAQAFIENPDNLPQVNHKNECKWDNAVWNLEWCTSDYNLKYGTRLEKAIKKSAKTQQLTHPTRKSVLQYTKDNQFVTEYMSMKEAERQTGINYSSISKCCLGKGLTAGGYIWKFKNNDLN